MEIPRLVVDVGMGLLSPNLKKYNPETDIPSLDGKVIIVTGGMYAIPGRWIRFADM
jgi:hypothetical protein